MKSCFLMYNGSWSSVHNPNWGKVGPTGFRGGGGGGGGVQGILSRLSQIQEAV